MGSKILQNGTVISWDDQTKSMKTLHNASILIVNDMIAAIANSIDELSASPDAMVIDVSGMIVTPGFVNTHCHMWQTAFRSMAPDIFIAQYFGWLSQMGAATKSFSGSDIYFSCLEGYCEGLNAGVTSVVDHATSNWNPDVVLPSFKAAEDGGARVWWCHDLHPGDAQELATLEKIRDELDANKKLVSMGLAPDMFDFSDDAAVVQLRDISMQESSPTSSGAVPNAISDT